MYNTLQLLEAASVTPFRIPQFMNEKKKENGAHSFSRIGTTQTELHTYV